MKKAIYNICRVLVIIVVFVIFMYVFSRYGWKLFGFVLCDAPSSIFAEEITVEDNEVKIKLGEASSISSYAGYVYKIENNNLFIGINHNMLISFFSGKVSYSISVNTNDQTIKSIYFRDSKNVWLIWTADEGRIKASNIKAESY